MARHILKAGYPLWVYSRSRSPIEALVAEGAQEADTPRELAQHCEVIISCLPDDSTVRKLWLEDENAALPQMLEGAIGIDMGTTSPRLTRELAEFAGLRGALFLDAPVTGGQWGAEAGTLTIMVGGDREAFEHTLPILQTMGKKVVYVGESGKGQLMKLANQIAVAVGMLAVSEALLFAERVGLELNQVVEVLSSGAAGSWAMENLGARIARRDFQPGFMIKLLQKDLRILLEEAGDQHIPLFGTALVHQLYQTLQASGEERLGTQALTLVLERLAPKPNDVW